MKFLFQVYRTFGGCYIITNYFSDHIVLLFYKKIRMMVVKTWKYPYTREGRKG